MLTKTRMAFGFNKALADLGLGSNGLDVNVHRELRMEIMEACLADSVSAKLAAARLFFVFVELGLISPSHLRIAWVKLDLWAAKYFIPDPDDLQADMASLFAEERKPRDKVEVLCCQVQRMGAMLR